MLSIHVSNKTSRERVLHSEGPFEIGRGPRREHPRAVVADPKVSSNQLRLERCPDGQILLENTSQRVHIGLADGTRIDPGGTRIVTLPARLHVGDTLIEIEAAGTPEQPGAGNFRTVDPPMASMALDRTILPARLSDDPTTGELARWFEALVAVQKAAASSLDFFNEAARAVVELIGLDVGMVLLRRGDDWTAMACHPPRPELMTAFSTSILDSVVRDRRTFYQAVNSTASSLDQVSAIVASPILGEDQQVSGVIYGARWARGGSWPNLRPLEAQLTQVIASAVAAGLARHYSEMEASRRRVQFEQFFTADLAAELDRDPGLLDGREREVTVMFADIRGFSAFSERLSPRETCALVGDIMEELTRKIREQKGVVVDYVGDGLLAMWNAPLEQPDHADLACAAALAMRATLPDLSARWQSQLGRRIDLGIGLNTGTALVGNTGSRAKFKYGPLGHAVNLASRVEGATKQMGVGILMTGSTRRRLNRVWATRRLCRARVIGIGEEVELHELRDSQTTAEWTALRDAYEGALVLHEAGKWPEACQALFALLSNGGPGMQDGPSLALLGRAVDCLRTTPSKFDPVVELSSK